MKKKKGIVQKVILITGLIIIPIVSIIMIAIDPDNKESKTAALVLLIGSALATLLATALLEIKLNLGKFARSFMSLCTGLCWLCLVLPFGILFPFFIVYSTTDESLGQIIKKLIGFTCIVIMVSVSFLSIVVNFLMKRMEYEKLAKWLSRNLRFQLYKEAVRSTVDVTRLVFE